MPVLAPNLEKCVFYLFREDPNTGDPTSLNGTGFLVARQSQALPYTYHVYGVSNRHVVANSSTLRINTRKGETRFLRYEPADWIWSDTSDLAVVDVTEQLDFSTETGLWGDEISWVDEKDFVPKPERSPYGISIGDNTIMLGLFADHSESKLNIPVGRFGSVAAIPNELNPVSVGASDSLACPSYLNDIRSRSGFSGSPVWVWRTPLDDMNYYKDAQGIWAKMHHTSRSFLALIGIHRGQFPDRVHIKLTAENSWHEAEIPSSMTVVVPAWEISTLLDSPRFKAQADNRDQFSDRIHLSQQICSIIRRQEESRRQINPHQGGLS
jgi:hypothetical protein